MSNSALRICVQLTNGREVILANEKNQGLISNRMGCKRVIRTETVKTVVDRFQWDKQRIYIETTTKRDDVQNSLTRLMRWSLFIVL